jgi:hypothetical protein
MEWEVPKKKKTFKCHQTPRYPLRDIKKQDGPSMTIETCVEVIEKSVQSIKLTEVYKDTIGYLRISQSEHRITNIIALGLGSFQKAHSSLQLSFLIALRGELEGSTGSIEVEVCDPVMNEVDLLVLQRFNMRNISNSLGKYTMGLGTKTLYFMPHCPHRLYSNVIFANFDRLPNLLILGNSFEAYKLRLLHTAEEDSTDCMRLVNGIVDECVLWDSRKHTSSYLPDNLRHLETAFNDFSAMTFTAEKISDEDWVKIQSQKPTEDEIDEASARDIEVFGENISGQHFGRVLREKHFQLSPSLTNLNHGSFGATPKCVTNRQIELMALQEAHPDRWFRKTYYELIDKSRERLAAFVNSPLKDLVLVENASSAVNSVLRSHPFQPGDAILRLNTAYSMVIDTVRWMSRTIGVDDVVVDLEFPISSPQEILSAVEIKLKAFPNVKLCVFSHISSMPTMIEPVKELTELCHRYGALVMIDGAHAPGQIPVDIQDINADFYLGNCHKWLFSVH